MPGRERLHSRLGSVNTTRPAQPGSSSRGCRGIKLAQSYNRSELAAMFRRRASVCAGCDKKADCYVAHQPACAQRRILSDPGKVCPDETPRW